MSCRRHPLVGLLGAGLVLPFALYYGLRLAGAEPWVALVLGGLAPLLRVLGAAARTRRLDRLGAFTLSVLALNTAVGLITADARLLMANGQSAPTLDSLRVEGDTAIMAWMARLNRHHEATIDIGGKPVETRSIGLLSGEAGVRQVALPAPEGGSRVGRTGSANASASTASRPIRSASSIR